MFTALENLFSLSSTSNHFSSLPRDSMAPDNNNWTRVGAGRRVRFPGPGTPEEAHTPSNGRNNNPTGSRQQAAGRAASPATRTPKQERNSTNSYKISIPGGSGANGTWRVVVGNRTRGLLQHALGDDGLQFPMAVWRDTNHSSASALIDIVAALRTNPSGVKACVQFHSVAERENEEDSQAFQLLVGAGKTATTATTVCCLMTEAAQFDRLVALSRKLDKAVFFSPASSARAAPAAAPAGPSPPAGRNHTGNVWHRPAPAARTPGVAAMSGIDTAVTGRPFSIQTVSARTLPAGISPSDGVAILHSATAFCKVVRGSTGFTAMGPSAVVLALENEGFNCEDPQLRHFFETAVNIIHGMLTKLSADRLQACIPALTSSEEKSTSWHTTIRLHAITMLTKRPFRVVRVTRSGTPERVCIIGDNTDESVHPIVISNVAALPVTSAPVWVIAHQATPTSNAALADEVFAAGTAFELGRRACASFFAAAGIFPSQEDAMAATTREAVMNDLFTDKAPEAACASQVGDITVTDAYKSITPCMPMAAARAVAARRAAEEATRVAAQRTARAPIPGGADGAVVTELREQLHQVQELLTLSRAQNIAAAEQASAQFSQLTTEYTKMQGRVHELLSRQADVSMQPTAPPTGAPEPKRARPTPAPDCDSKEPDVVCVDESAAPTVVAGPPPAQARFGVGASHDAPPDLIYGRIAGCSTLTNPPKMTGAAFFAAMSAPTGAAVNAPFNPVAAAAASTGPAALPSAASTGLAGGLRLD